MTDTLIDITNEVLRACGAKANKTVFAETDDTSYIRDRLNDALDEIYKLGPTQIDVDDSVTLPASTRVVSGPVGLDIYQILAWSLRVNQAGGDIPLELVTEEFIIENFPLYESDEAEFPKYVYFSNGDLAFYPLLKAGNADLTIQFKYPAQFVKLTSEAAQLPFPDRSDEARFMKLYAQFKLEVFKALGQPALTAEELERTLARLRAKYRRGKQFMFAGYRRMR